MPALSFQREFVDALLRGDKQHTTRPQTDRFKVGGIAQIYIEQRRRITEKPIRRMTVAGSGVVYERGYPLMKGYGHHTTNYHAHFLGKVEITEVYDIQPYEMSGEELEAWAKLDGFNGRYGFTEVELADTWFRSRRGDGYGDDWMQRTWTVIRWNGWQERYFEAGEV